MFRSKLHFAFAAGVCAALGSVFGKISGSTNLLNDLIESVVSANNSNKDILLQTAQIISFILMIICNASVWSFYVKALNSSSSSLPATVISTATNYITSALIGIILFGEVTSLVWWAGTSLVVLGLAIISKNANEGGAVESKKDI